MKWETIGIAVTPGQTPDGWARFYEWMKWAAAGVWTFSVSELYGPGPYTFIALYAKFVLIDVATGIFAAVIARKAHSRIALKGILSKFMGPLAIAMGHGIDQLAGSGGHTFRDLMAKLLIGYEALSISENLAVAGIVLPKSVRDAIHAITGKIEPEPVIVTQTVVTKTAPNTPEAKAAEEKADAVILLPPPGATVKDGP